MKGPGWCPRPTRPVDVRPPQRPGPHGRQGPGGPRRHRLAAGLRPCPAIGLGPASGDRGRRRAAGVCPPDRAPSRRAIRASSTCPSPGEGDRVRGRLSANYPESITLVTPGSAWSPWRWLDKCPPPRRDALRRLPGAPHVPPWPRRCCSAPASKSNPIASRPSSRPAPSTCWSSPACTGNPRRGRAPGGRAAARPAAGPCWAWRDSRCVYMLLVDAQPPVVRATVMVVVMARPGAAPPGVRFPGRGGAGGAGRQSRRLVSRRPPVVVPLRGLPDLGPVRGGSVPPRGRIPSSG